MLVGFAKFLKFSKNVIYAGRYIWWLTPVSMQSEKRKPPALPFDDRKLGGLELWGMENQGTESPQDPKRVRYC